MELKGKIGLIKYVRKITEIGLIEAKEIVEAFYTFYDAHCDVWGELDIIRLSLFVGKIKSGEWVIKNGRVTQETFVSYDDVQDLTEF